MSPLQIRRLGPAALCFVIALGHVGCSGWRQGYTLRQYQGQVLRVKDNGPGAERLQTEKDYDSTVRHFVQENGQPDYIYVADRFNLQLIYIDDDRVVLFQRRWWATESQATVTEGVPQGLATLMTRPDQARLAEARTHDSRANPDGSSP